MSVCSLLWYSGAKVVWMFVVGAAFGYADADTDTPYVTQVKPISRSTGGWMYVMNRLLLLLL